MSYKSFPAFPCNPDRYGDPHEGMDLRDYFAAQALVSMGTWMPTNVHEAGYGDLRHVSTLEARAIWAYAQADAMLAARKEG